MKVINEIAKRASLIYVRNDRKGIASLSQDELIDAAASLQEIVRELETYLATVELCEMDEIKCFKHIKPTIVGRAMFFRRLSMLDSSYLASSANCHIAFFDGVRNEIREYVAANVTIFRYYKTNVTTLDFAYFVRAKNFEPNMEVHTEVISPLSTIHDMTFAKFIYYGLLNDYISDKIDGLEYESKLSGPKQNLLTWTGSQATMVELGYAIFASGVVNSGGATIKDIMDALSLAFNKELNDFYRTFTDIKRRGGGSTVFLEELKSRLLDKIESEEL